MPKYGIAVVSIFVFDGTDQVSETFQLIVIEYQSPSNVERSTIISNATIGGTAVIKLDAV